MVNIETELLQPIDLGLNPSRKRAEVWIDYSGPVGIVRKRVARVRWNPKNQWNTVDPVYGCVGACQQQQRQQVTFRLMVMS